MAYVRSARCQFVFLTALLLSSPLLAQPAVHLGTVTVTEAGGNGANGVEPGEVGSISAVIFNDGGVTSTFDGVLTTSTPGVTIINGSSPYPPIAPAGSAANTRAFTFYVAPDVNCATSIAFTLNVSTGGGPSTPLAFAVNLGGPASTQTFSFTGPAVSIPDGVNQFTPGAPIAVPLLVSGFSAPISKVVFRFDGTSCNTTAGSTTVGLDHSFVGDLSISLTSPGNRTVSLLNRLTNGGGGNLGKNFCNTVLDDGAASQIQQQTEAAAPFTGTFRPRSALSAYNGDSANGTWNLNVTTSRSLTPAVSVRSR